MEFSKIVLVFKIYLKKRLFFLFPPELHVIADSHGVALKKINFIENFDITANFCVVPGATASGLANPNSKTQAYPIFKNYLHRYVKKNDFVLLQLGEVDCGFIIWLKSNKKEVDSYETMKSTLATYIDFIDKSVKPITQKIIICSAILPTIADNTDLGEVANLRKEVKASQLDRTEMTLVFNKGLKKYSLQNYLFYLDLDSSLLDQTTKVICDEFLNLDKTDHHPNPEKIAAVYKNQLKSNYFPKINFNRS
jgi:hypothetical protein